ncbi:hypothetical protein G9A89_006481 [Geosiphon pyriformis]|nr:hypothetical protein G9A89_006481 [Geosiphon pyriformis]
MSITETKETDPLLKNGCVSTQPNYTLYHNSTNDNSFSKNRLVKNDAEPATLSNQPIFDQTAELSLKDRIMVCIGLMAAVFLSALDQTIIAIALPKIGSEFNALSEIAWVGTSYMLTCTATQTIFAKLSDIFGRKTIFLVSIEIFTVGSIFCGAAPDMRLLIISRGIAGIGCGGIISMVAIIITEIVPLRERGKYQSIISVTYTLAAVIGPLVGGALTDHASWRWAFYLNVPVGILTIWIIWKLLNLPKVSGTLREKLCRIDYAGSLAFTISMVSILLSLSLGGNDDHQWGSPEIITLLITGFLFVLIFILIEVKVAKEPIIPIHLFKNINVLFSLISNFAIGMVFLGMIYYTSIYYQAVKGQNATKAGLQLVPLISGILLFSVLSGFAASITGRYLGWILSGYVLVGIGSVLISTADENTNQFQLIVYLSIFGTGFGTSFQTALLAPQSSVVYKDVALVTALVVFIRNIGGILGLAIYASTFNNTLVKLLVEVLPDDIPIDQVLNSIEYVYSLPPEIREPVIHAYAKAIQTAHWIGLPASIVAIFFTLFIKHRPLTRTLGPSITE